MAKNRVAKTLVTGDIWVCPAGVVSVSITKIQNPQLPRISPTTGMLSISGKLYAWGSNSNYALGVGDSFDRSSPVAVLGNLNFKVASISTSTSSLPSYGLTTSGTIYGWGLNQFGQLGVGDLLRRSSPVLVLGGLTWKSCAIGGGNSWGLTTSGQLYAWGYNANGQLGVGDTVQRSSPVLVLGGLSFRSVSTTTQQCYGITTAGALYAWGNNPNGELGVGDVVPRSSPVLVLGGLTWKAAYVGASSWGITTTGLLYAWGQNSYGQLGVGDVIPRSSPVLVLGGLTWKSAVVVIPESSPSYASYGITTEGKLYAWGNNNSGQLGVGNTVSRSSPVLVSGNLTFKHAVVGRGTFSATSYGITNTGRLYTWGANSYGQLGIGTASDVYVPTATVGGLFWKSVAIGNGNGGNSYGITTEGKLYAWGVNTNFSLGLGDSSHRSSPVAVLGDLTWQSAVIGYQNSYGVTTSGLLYAWGYNGVGALGVGDLVNRSSPVLVLGGLLADIYSVNTQQTVVVTPGSSYVVNLTGNNSTFGGTSLGTSTLDSIVVDYLL